jgi:hypothetical protein
MASKQAALKSSRPAGRKRPRKSKSPTNKQLALDVVRRLPDNATLDDIREEIEILASIQRGEEDIEAGRYTTNEEMKRQVAQWLSKSLV